MAPASSDSEEGRRHGAWTFAAYSSRMFTRAARPFVPVSPDALARPASAAHCGLR